MSMGRTLETFIPSDPDAENQIIVQLPIDRIDRNEHQPRQFFDEEALKELASSIEEKEVQTPISVRKKPDGRYEIIAGERRWRASKKAGKKTIPAIVKDVDEDEAFELAIIENVQREDLSPVEEAEALERLQEMRSYTQEQLSKIVGRSQTQVSQLLSINKVPQRLRVDYSTSNISRDHWFSVASLRDEDEQEGLLLRIQEENLTVRETRDAAKEEKKGKKAKPQATAPALVRDLKRIRERLGKETPGKWKVGDKEQLREELAAWKEMMEKLEGRL